MTEIKPRVNQLDLAKLNRRLNEEASYRVYLLNQLAKTEAKMEQLATEIRTLGGNPNE